MRTYKNHCWQDPNKKKWRFYEELEFLKEEIDKPKKPQFNVMKENY